MRSYPARAMYDQFVDMMGSLTLQLRSAILADLVMPQPARDASDPLRHASGSGRQISAELGSVLLDTLGLAATIEWHVRQYQRCTGIPCELTVSNAGGFDLPEDYATKIFGIYNEALSNLARQADARRVAIALAIAPHEVSIAVRRNDNAGTAVTVRLPLN